MDSDRTKARTSRATSLRLRLKENGLDALSPGEAVELLLGYAGVKDAEGASTRLLQTKANGGLRAVFDASDDTLAAVAGSSGALVIRIIKALGALYMRERLVGKAVSRDTRLLHDYLILSLGNEQVEKFVAVFLDASLKVMDVDVLHVGTINQTAVYPRVCVEAAMRRKAAGMIFAHNHPSGDPTPSAQDKALVGYLDKAAAAAGLTIFDHLIAGRERVFSFKEEEGWRMDRPSERRTAKAPRPGKRRDNR